MSAYTITLTNGQNLASVNDGTVNTTTTSLTLIGKNYAGYGVFLNENYVKLLENFAYSTAPNSPLTGQLWYDSANSLLKVYNGLTWKAISSSTAQATDPSGGVVGDLLWNTSSAQLKVYNGSSWIVIGPSYTTAAGTSGAVVETITDNSSGSHVVVKFYVSNVVIGILSKDASFVPQTSIAGFSSINPGFNLISSSTLSNARFTGDSSNALTLQGVNAAQFLRSDQNASTNFNLSILGNLSVGSSALAVTTSAGEVNLTNQALGRDFNLFVNRTGTITKAIGITGNTAAVTLASTLSVGGAATVTGNLTASSFTNLNGITVASNKIVPNANNTIDIGESSKKFATVYATTFNGTSVSAQYADLAERFEADAEYVPGTVVELGGVKEITAAGQDLSENVFGVISTAAAFLMNGSAGSNKTHPPVAVNGRVPVRVVGKVKKGDRLVSAGNGLARAATRSEITAFNVLGRALQDKTTLDEGTIEAIVKLNS